MFISVLKKADDKVLDKIYGSTHKTLSEENNAKILGRRDNMFSKNNLYTVGEFLREHHHEIAYDIAVNGFPRKNRREDFFPNIKYKKLIGIIAKSHRGNLRSIMEEAEIERIAYAEQGYSPFNIPLAYFMAIIWIADEIDDKAEYRSPLSDMLDKDLTPFSAQQWQDNMCVIDTTINADKSMVFIHAMPENTNQFLRVQAYSQKVQFAIDQSVAVYLVFVEEIEGFHPVPQPRQRGLALAGHHFVKHVGESGLDGIRRFLREPFLQMGYTRPKLTNLIVGYPDFAVFIAQFRADPAPLHPGSGGA